MFEMDMKDLEQYLQVNFPSRTQFVMNAFKEELKEGVPPKMYRVVYYKDKVSAHSLDPAAAAEMLTQIFKVVQIA